MEDLKQHQEACQREFLPILKALAASAVEKTTIDMNDILELPVDHRMDSAPRARTPTHVLTTLGIRSVCNDIGLWTLPDLPAIEITDENSRIALAKAREFTNNNEADGGKATFRAFVAASTEPLYQAFDYTADFHSRDLDVPSDQSDRKAWLDLSPFGKGYHRIDKDCDEFSVQFADSLEHNTEYFQNHEWQPGMYDQFRAERKSIITDKLGGNVDMESATTLKFNLPVWQMPEEVRERCLQMLKVGDDEELVFEGYEVRKRKKTQDGHE
jgi:hypothetical protein